MKEKPEKNEKIRYLDYPSTMTFNVIGDLVIINIASKEILTITIESEDVAKGYRAKFETMWKQTKP